MRKSVFRTFVIAVLMVALFTVPAYAEDATVTGSDVNFRSGPGLDYSVVDCLPLGAVVTVNDRSNSDWYAVSYNGTEGFISSRYLRISDEAATVSAPASTVNETSGGSAGYINAMYVRFRSAPGGSILGEYNKGKELTITGSQDGWMAVVIDGVAGYVFADYVSYASSGTVSAPAETPAPAEAPAPAETPTVVENPGSIIDGAPTTPAVAETPSAPAVVTTTAPSAPAATVSTGSGSASVKGSITGDYVRFRSGPSMSDSILGSYDRGKELTITGTSGDWTAVVIDGVSGYVYSAYVRAESSSASTTPTPSAIAYVPTTQTSTGFIKGSTVRFRSEASLSSAILGEYNTGKELTITGTYGDWTAAVIDGVSGYVYSAYVSTEQPAKVVTSAESSELGTQIAQYALQYVGYPYVWGGSSPDGFDCSGFTSYVYRQFGYTLNRVACDQANNGVAVDLDSLQPGDILCFYSGNNYIGHVGIYIGDNKFVHASTSTTGVIISELSGYYNSRGYIARRIV